jgi:hypothetical protein
LDLVFPANEPYVYVPQELASWMNSVFLQSSLQIDGPTQMTSDGIFHAVYSRPRDLVIAAIVFSLALAGWQMAVLLRKRWPMKWPLHLVLILGCSGLSAVCFTSPLVSLLPRLPSNEPAMMPAEQVWSFPRRNDDEAAFTSLDGTGLSQRAGTAREKGTPGANRFEPSSVEGGTPAERQFCLGSTPHRFDRGGLHMRYEPRTARADADGARQRCDLYIEPDALPQVEADQAHYVLAQKAYYSGDIRQLHVQLGAMTGIWAPTQLRHRLALAYLRSEVGLPDGKASLADLARQIQPRWRRASEMLTAVSAAILLFLSCACAIIGLLRQRKARGVIMILGPVSKPPAQTGGAIS